MKYVGLLLFAVLAAGSGTAHGQAQIVPTDVPKGAEKTDVEGWAPFLGLTSTLTVVDNSSVVGQADGFSTIVGLGVLAGADWVRERHLFRFSAAVNEGFARTPVLPQFVKNNDVFKLDGLYNYFVTDNLGGYGRLNITTALTKTDDIRATPTNWSVYNADGMTTTPLLQGGTRQPLSDAFKPFTFNGSAGGFAEPIRGKELDLSVRAGLGGRLTFADGVLVNKDVNMMTNQVDLIRLSNVYQLGLELFTGAVGKLQDGKASYKAGFSLLLPAVNNDKYNRSATSLTRIGIEAGLSFNVFSWMALNYSLNIVKDPQLFQAGKEVTQVQNTLLATFQFTLVKKREKAKEPTKEELELKAAKDKADGLQKELDEIKKKLDSQNPTPPTTDPNAPSSGPTPTPTTDPNAAPTP